MEPRRTYVTFYVHGSLYDETETRLVETRNLGLEVPARAHSFQFFDRTDGVLVLDGDTIAVSGIAKNRSPRYYPGGRLLTQADVHREYGADSILASNMECNGWERVVKTRWGGVQEIVGDVELLP